ncbi:MAG: DUF4870 domain-containing protein [Cocleimonas sp.]
MNNEENPYKNLKPLDPKQRKWGMALHMAALIGLLLPLGLVLGPLIVWMLKKNDGEFFDSQGKQAVNFQLTILLSAFVFALLGTVIKPIFTLAFMAGLAGIIFSVIAGISVSRKGHYQYPFSFKFIK